MAFYCLQELGSLLKLYIQPLEKQPWQEGLQLKGSN